MRKDVVIAVFAMAILFLISGVPGQEITGSEINSSSENGILVKWVIPNIFSVGDAQFSVFVENGKNETINSLIALVTARGFSTYDVIPTDLNAWERGYILVRGNFKEEGNISLLIRINGKVYRENVSVIGGGQANSEEQERLAREKQALLANFSAQLSGLKQKYSLLEAEIGVKKNNNYDMSGVSLIDAKKYIVAADSSILGEEVTNAKINIRLAEEELAYQQKKLDDAPVISRIERFKDYALIFSALAGAIITFFALSELLKRKSVAVASGVRHGVSHVTSRMDKKNKGKK